MCAANPRLAYNIEHIIQKLAKQPVESLSVNEIARQQKKANWFEVQSSANWVQRELPVRIAHRLYEFNRLPFIVVTNPHIHKVYKKYSSALIQSFSTKTIETKEQDMDLDYHYLNYMQNILEEILAYRAWRGLVATFTSF
eukprot:GHVL01022502.1.p1 GENE.GHVL01022502.1~~GHVL01022502.1.p1  ORF type:complete len:140 (+),score=12.71 GHVL01022502.1:154-573(+)